MRPWLPQARRPAIVVEARGHRGCAEVPAESHLGAAAVAPCFDDYGSLLVSGGPAATRCARATPAPSPRARGRPLLAQRGGSRSTMLALHGGSRPRNWHYALAAMRAGAHTLSGATPARALGWKGRPPHLHYSCDEVAPPSSPWRGRPPCPCHRGEGAPPAGATRGEGAPLRALGAEGAPPCWHYKRSGDPLPGTTSGGGGPSLALQAEGRPPLSHYKRERDTPSCTTRGRGAPRLALELD